MPEYETNGSTINYYSFTKGPELKYLRKGIFQFKGIEFDLNEARFLADSIGDILAGKSFLITKNITATDEEELRQIIDKRLHAQNAPLGKATPILKPRSLGMSTSCVMPESNLKGGNSMINKSDYLKNYGNVMLTCSVEINGKLFKRGLSINFTSPEGELNFSKGASELYYYLEKTILFQNGYYDAVQKALKEATNDTD
jgi:hypothetical protein